MAVDVKKMIETKDCVICKHVKQTIGEGGCLGCIQSGTKKDFEVMHTCLTCKHTLKKMTEEPCMICGIEYKKWEVLDAGEDR